MSYVPKHIERYMVVGIFEEFETCPACGQRVEEETAGEQIEGLDKE
jgi:transcription initiation factor IIE alpha subunit